jgi:hypothetical protein
VARRMLATLAERCKKTFIAATRPPGHHRGAYIAGLEARARNVIAGPKREASRLSPAIAMEVLVSWRVAVRPVPGAGSL